MNDLTIFAHITAHEIPDLLLYLVTGMGVGFVFLFQSITSSRRGSSNENGKE